MAKKKVDFHKRPQDQIFKLHVSIPETDPLVWRQILVPGIFTLEALHSVIQLVMGWQMKHLYEFQIGGERYAEPDEFGELPAKSVAATLASALREEASFKYTYDFGDDWEHEVRVEEISSRDELFTYPICVGGANACPPEDCHGVPGYADLKKTISNPKAHEHKEMLQWLGGFFDSTAFDPNRINRDMLWMIDWRKGPNDEGLYLPFNADDEDDDYSSTGDRRH